MLTGHEVQLPLMNEGYRGDHVDILGLRMGGNIMKSDRPPLDYEPPLRRCPPISI